MCFDVVIINFLNAFFVRFFHFKIFNKQAAIWTIKWLTKKIIIWMFVVIGSKSFLIIVLLMIIISVIMIWIVMIKLKSCYRIWLISIRIVWWLDFYADAWCWKLIAAFFVWYKLIRFIVIFRNVNKSFLIRILLCFRFEIPTKRFVK